MTAQDPQINFNLVSLTTAAARDHSFSMHTYRIDFGVNFPKLIGVIKNPNIICSQSPQGVSTHKEPGHPAHIKVIKGALWSAAVGKLASNVKKYATTAKDKRVPTLYRIVKSLQTLRLKLILGWLIGW